MTLKMSFLYALFFGGFIIDVQGDDYNLYDEKLYRSCCRTEVLVCMDCFPLEARDVGLPPTTKTIERDCQIQTYVQKCFKTSIILCLLHTNLGEENCTIRAFNKRFTADECKQDVIKLCTEGSELRERYLGYAECIREQKRFIDADDKFVDTCVSYPDPGPLEECDFMFKKWNCFLKQVINNCGLPARFLLPKWGKVFHVKWADCMERREMEKLKSSLPTSTVETTSDLGPHGEQTDELTTVTEEN